MVEEIILSKKDPKYTLSAEASLELVYDLGPDELLVRTVTSAWRRRDQLFTMTNLVKLSIGNPALFAEKFPQLPWDIQQYYLASHERYLEYLMRTKEIIEIT